MRAVAATWQPTASGGVVRGVLHPPGTGTVVLAAWGGENVFGDLAPVAPVVLVVPLGRAHAPLESTFVTTMAEADARRCSRMAMTLEAAACVEVTW